MSPKTIIVITTVVVAVVAGLLSFISIEVPSPPEWLGRWTGWAITFIALLKAPGLAEAAITRLERQ